MPDLEKIKQQKRDFYNKNKDNDDFRQRYRDYAIKFYNNNKEKIIHRVKLQKINKKLTLYDPSYVEQLKQNEDLLNALKETNKTLYRLIYRFNILQIEGQQFL